MLYLKREEEREWEREGEGRERGREREGGEGGERGRGEERGGRKRTFIIVNHFFGSIQLDYGGAF